ncbi:MupG family TIM beta-alpha barrel fold protein [Paenibacillus sp. M1]|uniref:MupG family TIM beta-alpha barrel fold protein n=1 Tax=Paenibacillus haidiansis TaxID=1574488 RepID=A0ABU7VWU6_9BACL
MGGVLVSLTEQSIDRTLEYLAFMRQYGFDTIFTSLQIPEEEPADLLEPLGRIGGFAGEHGMELMVDVSPRAFRNFTLGQLKDRGVTGLRIDNGMENAEIAALTHNWQVSLNASTIDQAFLDDLGKLGADFSALEAWHNYYPRPETGLEWNTFKAQNEWLRAQGLKVGAFIPGDGRRRGPLYEGLPTLEQHRHQSPFASYLELHAEGAVDLVVIGDLSLGEWTMKQFISWHEGIVLLGIREQRPSHVWEEVHHNRPDIARDVIRSEEARRHFRGSIPPDHCVERPRGALTLDNDNYMRYKGEFQIVVNPLPSDERVNVIGYVAQEDLPLLPLLQKWRYPFRFLARDQDRE